MRRLLPASLFVLALFAASCSGASHTGGTPTTPATAAPPLPTTSLRYAGGSITVEVAKTEPDRERGLGYRDALAASTGMLFDLEQAVVPAFWMKGMRFPLDMVWISEDKRVVAVAADVPPEPGVADARLRRYSPGAATRYVLELNAGDAARLGLHAGDQLDFSIP
jgi:hypothetical protein